MTHQIKNSLRRPLVKSLQRLTWCHGSRRVLAHREIQGTWLPGKSSNGRARWRNEQRMISHHCLLSRRNLRPTLQTLAVTYIRTTQRNGLRTQIRTQQSNSTIEEITWWLKRGDVTPWVIRIAETLKIKPMSHLRRQRCSKQSKSEQITVLKESYAWASRQPTKFLR